MVFFLLYIRLAWVTVFLVKFQLPVDGVSLCFLVYTVFCVPPKLSLINFVSDVIFSVVGCFTSHFSCQKDFS